MDPGSEVHRILIQHDKLMPERVVGMLSGAIGRSFFTDILSSQLDADRLDYLLRDNHMTGSRYGDFDLNWLLHAFTIDPATNRLAISIKGVSAVEAYLQSRYHMYRNVYFHKVVRSAEGMVKLALQRARRLAVQDRLEDLPRDSAVAKALLGQRFSSDEFRGLDDISVWHCFKVWTGSSDATLAGLCRGLLFRRLYKTIDLSNRCDSETAKRVFATAVQHVRDAGGDPAYDLFYDEPADTPYEAYRPDASEGNSGEIVVLDTGGGVSPFAAVSPITQALNRQLMFRRIHFKPEWKELITATMDDERQN
jgi:HD superfamily phosphohydrolase